MVREKIKRKSRHEHVQSLKPKNKLATGGKKCERKNGKVGKHAHTADISNVLSGQRAESGICYMMPWLRCLGQFPTDAEHTSTKSAIA